MKRIASFKRVHLAANRSPPPHVGDRPDHRADGQQRADHRLDFGCWTRPLATSAVPPTVRIWRIRARIADFSMVFSCSGLKGGGEEFARLHGRQALQARGVGCGPARAEQAGFGDARDGDSIGLVATQHEEMRVVLSDSEADMAAGAALKISTTPVTGSVSCPNSSQLRAH